MNNVTACAPLSPSFRAPARLGLWLAVLASSATTAAAQPVAPAWWGFVELGQHAEAQAATLGVGRDWRQRWSLWGGSVGGRWELTAGRWFIDERSPGGPSHVSHVGLTPMLRWTADQGRSPWFVEGGIGVNYITPLYQANGDRFSTRWNFGDHLGLGRRFGDGQRHELSLRLSHYSNGGARKPNPGAEFVQLRYALRWD